MYFRQGKGILFCSEACTSKNLCKKKNVQLMIATSVGVSYMLLMNTKTQKMRREKNKIKARVDTILDFI